MKKILYGLLIVSAIQYVSLHGANLTFDEAKEIFDYNIQNNSIHSFGESCILYLLHQFPREERAIYALKILNYYQETNRVHEFNGNNLCSLLSYLSQAEQITCASNILGRYQEIDIMHKFNNLCSLLGYLTQAEREIYASNILDYYRKTNRIHKLNRPFALLHYLPEAKKITHISNILDHYNHKKTLFKYDPIVKLIKIMEPTLPELLSNCLSHTFAQKLASIEKNYHQQLHMFYIRKTIEESNLPVESSFFSEELLKPLLLEDIVAIIEHIHESTDICGQSMEKVRPLCQAYLMHCKNLPNSMLIEHFTDLFEPFRTRTPLLAKITDSMVTFKSIIPQSLIQISKFKGDTLTFRPDIPQKIQELYAQYKYTNIVENTIIVSRDEQPSIE